MTPLVPPLGDLENPELQGTSEVIKSFPKAPSKRGYVGIGVYGSKWESNVGTLWRAARLYGADFIFTIGQRYKRQATDTPDTPRHTPLFEYIDWHDFTSHLPTDCEVVLIEQSATSKPLPSFRHPTRAVYVLGAEDHGLPEELLGVFPTVEIPTLEPQSMNVSAAGTLVLYDRHTKRTDLLVNRPALDTLRPSDAPKPHHHKEG